MIPGHILTVAILAMFLFVWITTCPCFNPSIPSRTVRSRPWNFLCRPHCPHDRPARENGSYSTWLMQGSNSWYSGCTESTHVNWHWNIMKYLYSCNNDIQLIQLIQPTILSTNVIWLVDFSEIQVVIAILDSPACSDAKVKKHDTKKPEQTWGYGSIPINTIFRGMNIHLPAILMFIRCQGFDPSPHGSDVVTTEVVGNSYSWLKENLLTHPMVANNSELQQLIATHHEKRVWSL